MKYKYRIVQIEKELFQVQFRKWFFPFWKELNHHRSLRRAKMCVNYQRDNKFPKVIRYTETHKVLEM